jgi:hypothetical protein
VNPGGLALGVVAMLMGLALGSWMLASPEGVNPAYPIWIALLAPLAFVLGGALACAHAVGRPAAVAITFKAFALCLLLIVNWAAFFTSHIHCRETLSLLGVAILERYPSEIECRASLRIVTACLDTAVLVFVAMFVWRKVANRNGEPTN